MKMQREEVYKIIDGERDYQLLRWGYNTVDGKRCDNLRSPAEYVLYMQHYINEAIRLATVDTATEPVLEMVRKVIALGVRCGEQHGLPPRQ
jgi:hypothetical protein